MVKKGFYIFLLTLSTVWLIAGCTAKGASTDEKEKVVILTNGDEEAVASMETALKGAGYEGQYVFQSLGTSELGGKLMAEGKQIEANIVTMSSYFIESAQENHNMFTDLTFTTDALEKYPPYYMPVLANTGSIFVNTEVLKKKGLSMPSSIADLTEPEFKGLVSIPNIMDSSTGWLLVQAIVSQYGEEEGKTVLQKLIANVGPHLESSGSGPIKKVQAGETAAGFGLRHQAVIAKGQGMPIDYVDPTEGNFSLTEAVAVVDKEDGTMERSMKMAEVITKDARKGLIQDYPVALYDGEVISQDHQPSYTNKFKETLTVELLKKHQDYFNSAK
ncbi:MULTISPECIES: extracellular solute-binding protein [unclassified Sporosarcina]|uniref:extracellular solute-binding protein n=1 Tax=unclassified Sporosarcina TaxID=2647733 RepID=UPI00203F7980|nr:MULTISPECIES: extracellular solute-binding protein [unclassified Sporosarcina]GKV66472.1 putative 2-aminoethylphosphonate ABC transporter substrate-binding protein [Sporosarcina sp. NCCP-2331]GLB56749.1 putative 2-aminoethylphosphonate ABC transporter substrate-binding protein [Sporosarcina sp. NCCP-2378]